MIGFAESSYRHLRFLIIARSRESVPKKILPPHSTPEGSGDLHTARF